MSIIFDSVDIRGLRVIHFEQLLSYIRDCGFSGIYYGNQAQFWKRHLELENWVAEIIDHAKSEGVVIPRKKGG